MLGTLISHYKLLDTLGSGGMGIVYRAEDTRLGRQVALKCLPPEVAANPQAVERLLREARSAATLNHPNICTIYEVNEAAGHHFITMELLEGQTLRERIAAGPIETNDAIRLALQIADALDAAHKKSVIHRDIKPANIFITQRGDAKVLDFGLAKLEGALLPRGAASLTAATLGAEPLHLTSPGQAVGTIAYMSPEQARGEEVDARSDVFSFGVVLYEMVTGRPPFAGSTSALIFDAILNRTPAPPSRADSAIPPALEHILFKLLEKDARLRYQSAPDLLADLRRLHRDATSAASSAASVSPPAEKKRRAGKTIDSLAVLPFTNATGIADLDYLGDAIAEGVLDALSCLPKLRVVPRHKAFRHRTHFDDLQTVRRDLDVRAILSGRITRRGDTLSIRAELIDVAKDTQLWGTQINRAAEDLVAIQEEIARGVADKIAGPSSGGARSASGSRPAAETSESPQAAALLTRAARSAGSTAVRKEAYQLHMRATHHAHKWTSEGLRHGINLYRQAIDADPTYAPAYAGMAVAHAISTITARVDVQDYNRHARAYARRAIELDESLGEAHAALGIAHLWGDLDVAAALREGKRGFDLDPNSGATRYLYAMTLACDSRLDEAAEIARQGIEIDPLMIPINYCYGLIRNYQRRWPEAEAQLRRTLDLDPQFLVARAVLGIVLARAGRFEEAFKEADAVAASDMVAAFRPVRAYVAALAGDSATARAMLADRELMATPTGCYFAAATLGVLGELDKGFAELERARDFRFSLITTAAVNPSFDPYHSDPRWPPFLRTLNLRV